MLGHQTPYDTTHVDTSNIEPMSVSIVNTTTTRYNMSDANHKFTMTSLPMHFYKDTTPQVNDTSDTWKVLNETMCQCDLGFKDFTTTLQTIPPLDIHTETKGK